MKLVKIAWKTTNNEAILASITLSGEHILQVLDQYPQVLSQYLPNIVTIMASIE